MASDLDVLLGDARGLETSDLSRVVRLPPPDRMTADGVRRPDLR